MKFLVILSVIVAAVSAEKSKCEPGRVFKEDCNICVCGPDGLTAACTSMMCIPGQDNVTAVHASSDEKSKCEPGRVFKADCNTCVCNADGVTAACTIMMCLPNSSEENYTTPDRLSSAEQSKCEPGRVFKQDCNTCICGPDGLTSACTMMMCLPNSSGQDNVATVRGSFDEKERGCDPEFCGDDNIWDENGNLKPESTPEPLK